MGFMDILGQLGNTAGDAAAKKMGFAAAAPAVAGAIPGVAAAIPGLAGAAGAAAPGALMGAAGGPIGLVAGIGLNAISDAIARNKQKDVDMANAQAEGAGKIGANQTSALGSLMNAYRGIA